MFSLKPFSSCERDSVQRACDVKCSALCDSSAAQKADVKPNQRFHIEEMRTRDGVAMSVTDGPALFAVEMNPAVRSTASGLAVVSRAESRNSAVARSADGHKLHGMLTGARPRAPG